MVNVRRRDFDQDVIEEPATVSPPRARIAAQNPAPRTVTFRLPPDHVWRVARNGLFVAAWALMGSARITALDEKGREFHTFITGDDLWLFDPRLAHSIRAVGGGCVLCLTLVPSLNVDDALSLLKAVEPAISAV